MGKKATLAIWMLCALMGCDVAHHVGAERPATLHAECPVCRYNADLACVDISIDDTTPRAEFDGRTVYFCSNECRERFENNASEYLVKNR
jgi:YHS domain-containing protein